MKNEYKLIFIGYILIALKVFNVYAFHLLGLLGYLLIGIQLCKIGKSRGVRLAAFGAFGLFVLTGYEFMKVQVNNPSMLNIAVAIIQMILYIVLNWILIYYMFEDITSKLKEKKMINDANTCQNNKTKFMNLMLLSVIFQNGAIIFPKLGTIIFLIGVVLAVYLSIKEVFYMKKVSILMCS